MKALLLSVEIGKYAVSNLLLGLLRLSDYGGDISAFIRIKFFCLILHDPDESFLGRPEVLAVFCLQELGCECVEFFLKIVCLFEVIFEIVVYADLLISEEIRCTSCVEFRLVRETLLLQVSSPVPSLGPRSPGVKEH